MGFSGITLNSDIAREIDLEPNQHGVLVVNITPDSPADEAGLEGSDRLVTINDQEIRIGGDVITSINGQSVNDFEDLVAYLARYTEVGEKVTLTLIRDGKQQTRELTLGARPTQEQKQEYSTGNTSTAGAWLGITGMTMNSVIAHAMGLPSKQEGVLVLQVHRDSPAANAGLKGSFKSLSNDGQTLLVGGDIISKLDDENITAMADLKAALQEYKPGQEVQLTVLRNGQEEKVPVTLESKP
jgi:2-alkenal reductase